MENGYARLRKQIAVDPTYSFWIKTAIEQLEQRDPLDAATDAQTLCRVQQLRWKNEMKSEATPTRAPRMTAAEHNAFPNGRLA